MTYIFTPKRVVVVWVCCHLISPDAHISSAPHSAVCKEPPLLAPPLWGKKQTKNQKNLKLFFPISLVQKKISYLFVLMVNSHLPLCPGFPLPSQSMSHRLRVTKQVCVFKGCNSVLGVVTCRTYITWVKKTSLQILLTFNWNTVTLNIS